MTDMDKDAVHNHVDSLIEEIHKLQKENERLKYQFLIADQSAQKLQAENERLQNVTKVKDELYYKCEQLQADVKELVECLMEVRSDLDDVASYDGGIDRDTHDKIDSLLAKHDKK